MKSLILLLNSTLITLLIQGCALYNPFIPQAGQEIIYDEQSPQVSEPIRSKSMYRATMKPYCVSGVTYTPIVPKIGEQFRGIASWYGPNFHGNKTSNGEYYDMHASTAAHKTLPINTLLQVTNLDNGLSTIVRINDRGPFVKNRIIDLSYQAALDIGLIKKGTAKVQLEVIDFDKSILAYRNNTTHPREGMRAQATKKIHIERSEPLAYKVQISSTQNRQKANELLKKYAIIDGKYRASLKTKTFWQRTYYKILIGDFESADEAQNFIADHYFDGAFVVKD